jgi:hypothetical protein
MDKKYGKKIQLTQKMRLMLIYFFLKNTSTKNLQLK